MSFFYVMSVLIGIGGAISTFLFRRGGIYNPTVPESDVIEPPDLPLEPQIVTVAPPKPTTSALFTFCTAIRDFEGKPGDLSYKNNNPGNCRCSSIGYLPMYGNVLCVDTASGRFAKFPSFALGWLYLQNLVHFRAHLHPDWTIFDFFNDYAPAADKNSPHTYAVFVAKRCGVVPTTLLKDLFA